MDLLGQAAAAEAGAGVGVDQEEALGAGISATDFDTIVRPEDMIGPK